MQHTPSSTFLAADVGGCGTDTVDYADSELAACRLHRLRSARTDQASHAICGRFSNRCDTGVHILYVTYLSYIRMHTPAVF